MKAENKKYLVLVHDPTDELFIGALHPDAALFSDYIDIREANREHRAFRRLLSKCGYEVRTVREVLLEGTVDAHGKPIRGKKFNELKEFASQFLEYDSSDGTVDAAQQEQYKQQVLAKAHPVDLINVILTRPKIILHSTDANTGFSADYMIRPLMNLIFTRDSMLSTRKGMIIGRFHSPQRTSEHLVAEFCLHKLGVEPIFKMPTQGDAYLEGGDFVACGDISFLCYGMRTTWPAVEMLLDNDVFGTGTVVVVKDRLFSQAQMHLDTYFNMADDNLAVLCENRYNANAGDPEFLTVDVYTRTDGKYVLSHTDEPFMKYLESRNIKVIPISEADGDTFGANILRVAPREIIAVSKKSAAYRSAMRRNGVKVHWVDLTHCTKGYGAAHCMTQIIKRQ